MALFAEKYGEVVRMLTIGDFSRELCGGTHLTSTGKAGFCKILKAEAIGRGLRRIEAVCGQAALEYLNNLEKTILTLSQELKAPQAELPNAVLKLKENLKNLDQKILSLEKKLAHHLVKEVLAQAKDSNYGKLVAEKISGLSPQSFREFGDRLKSGIKSGAIFLAQERNAQEVALLCFLTPDLVEKGFDAGKILGQLAQEVGGKGGGRADFAQAGGKNISGLPGAFAKFYQIFKGE